MDAGLIGLIVVIGIVAAAVLLLRPKAVVSLDSLLATLAHIEGDASLTAVQKKHEAEVAYRSYQRQTVSLIGAVADVFPNGAVVVKTSSRELPALGIELRKIPHTELRALAKGKAVTLRARLPDWKTFRELADLPDGFQSARAFFAGRWYDVKSIYRIKS